MIQRQDVLNLNYYKKTSFTGWTGGMRFLIRREIPQSPESGSDSDTAPASDAENIPDPDPVFRVYVWPGPYNFEKTADRLKTDQTFPFNEDGLSACVDWLNEQLETGSWPEGKITDKR